MYKKVKFKHHIRRYMRARTAKRIMVLWKKYSDCIITLYANEYSNVDEYSEPGELRIMSLVTMPIKPGDVLEIEIIGPRAKVYALELKRLLQRKL